MNTKKNKVGKFTKYILSRILWMILGILIFESCLILFANKKYVIKKVKSSESLIEIEKELKKKNLPYEITIMTNYKYEKEFHDIVFKVIRGINN